MIVGLLLMALGVVRMVVGFPDVFQGTVYIMLALILLGVSDILKQRKG